jgi:hypothetical protein
MPCVSGCDSGSHFAWQSRHSHSVDSEVGDSPIGWSRSRTTIPTISVRAEPQVPHRSPQTVRQNEHTRRIKSYSFTGKSAGAPCSNQKRMACRISLDKSLSRLAAARLSLFNIALFSLTATPARPSVFALMRGILVCHTVSVKHNLCRGKASPCPY